MRNSSAAPFAKVASYDAYCYFVASFAYKMALAHAYEQTQKHASMFCVLIHMHGLTVA